MVSHRDQPYLTRFSRDHCSARAPTAIHKSIGIKWIVVVLPIAHHIIPITPSSLALDGVERMLLQ